MASLIDSALTTLTAVNGELGYTDAADSSRDDRIKRYVNEGSRVFSDLTGRGWHYEASYVERVAAQGGHTLQVHDRLPISSIGSIVFDDRSGTTTTIDSDSYAIEEAETGRILRVRGHWQNFTYANRRGLDHAPNDRRRHWKVTYTGGFITPKQEDDAVGTRDLPYDIEAAVIKYAVMRHAQEGGADTIKVIQTLGDRIEYFGDDAGGPIAVPSAFKAAVLRYRRWS